MSASTKTEAHSDDEVVVGRFMSILQPIASDTRSDWSEPYVELEISKAYAEPGHRLQPIVTVKLFPEHANPIARDQINIDSVVTKLVRVLGVAVKVLYRGQGDSNHGTLVVVAGKKQWFELLQRFAPDDADAARVVREIFYLQ